MDQLIKDTLAGVVGYIWPFFGEANWQSKNYAANIVKDANRVKVAVLAPLPLGSFFDTIPEHKLMPDSLLAVSEVHGTLFFDVTRIGGHRTAGGPKASSRYYFARGMAVGFRFDELKSSKFYEMTAFFPGMEYWSAITGSTTDVEHDQHRRPKVITTRIESAPEQTTSLSPSRSISVSTHFAVTGPKDDQRVFTPLSVSSVSRSPIDWREHMNTLISIQNLVSLCWDGFVRADGGYVRLALIEPSETSNAKLWSDRLMQLPVGTETPDPHLSFPLLRYETIGGVDGIRRWLRLSDRHDRATGPLTARHRISRSTPAESQLLDLCTGIEYWVNFHKKSTNWAKPQSSKDVQPERLARHLGKHFTEFVGDPQKWARLLWDRYGALKHQPLYRYDAREIAILAASARVLLLCAVMNRVAHSKVATKTICESHRNDDLKWDVRELLTGQRYPDPPTDDSVFHNQKH
ncbi:hypothetical protein [Mycobacterium sp. 48b]|uniref:ApeA N-terminal domain 1-containing protein n=1 Tax=Mycobacterium sp. 48b TaxID=3400426 RepID=UPI003AAFB5B6